MRSHKKMTDLVVLEQLQEKDVVGGFTNDTYIAKKKPPRSHFTRYVPQKYKNEWFLKKNDNEETAMREVLAQEFFRLFISSHPKTRLVEDRSGKSYIISKAVPGFCSLASLEEKILIKDYVKNGMYQGLGEVLVMALFVNEIDLRPTNLGVDDRNRIVKIDGDLCFAKLSQGNQKENYNISASDISQLPHLCHYSPNNWLDHRVNGFGPISRYIATHVIDADMSTNLFFRAEVNRTMLKIILLPNRMIRNFIHAYVCTETEAEVFYNEIIARKAEINNAATRNFAFCDYLKTETAKQDLKNFIGDLYQFKTTGKNHLWRNERDKKNMYAQLDELHNAVEEEDLRRSQRSFLGTLFNYVTGNRNDNASETIKRLMY